MGRASVLALLLAMGFTPVQAADLGYLGPPGTYSEQAADAYRGADPAFATLRPQPSITAVAEAVARGALPRGLLPGLSTTAGFPAESHLALLRAHDPGFRILGAVIVPIETDLLVRPGTQLADIRAVLSHPNALAEAGGFLRARLPHVALRPVASTAAAAAMALRPGEAGVSLGTSGTVFAIADRPAADPTGTVAGFASADGHFLPLACTLNATLAIDRIAGWLGLGREDVAPSDGVVCLPWLDGERTPDEPTATGTMGGLRHTTSRGAMLQAAYEGAVATVLGATGALDRWAPQDPDAPLVLLGGGARGTAWRRTVGRLSGRPLLVPHCSEPVAYGAAVQAGALLRNMPVDRLAAEWDARSGDIIPAVPRDDEVLDRIAVWRRNVLGRPG
jgi:hypothetical protein